MHLFPEKGNPSMQQLQQHILSTLPYLMLPVPLEKSLQLDRDHLDEFSQGYLSGSDAAYSARKEGEAIRTVQDLWAFLSAECSPHTLAREELLNQAVGGSPTPLAYRAGFIVGYLHTMFAPCPHPGQSVE
jgi:hypothetical protein